MKPNYGFDAPGVIRWLLIFSIISLCIALFGYFNLSDPLHALLLGGYFALTTLSFLIPALWMIYSSLKGKQQFLSHLIDSLSLNGHERILDVGCGRGLFLIEAAKRLTSGRAFGVWTHDQSGNTPETTLRNATLEHVHDRVEVISADMTHLPFPTDTFDLVLSNLAIHNIPDPDDHDTALREILRVLKPNGTFLLIDIRNTPHYATYLQQNGAQNVTLSSKTYRYFPPVRIVKGKKR